jgi:nucleotide-binding universal stress UspA family protein
MMAPRERTEGPQDLGSLSSYRRIVVALDGSERAERILPHVVLLAQQFRAAVTLVRVVTPGGPLVPEVPDGAVVHGRTVHAPSPDAERQRWEAGHYVRALADRLRAEGLSVDWLEAEGPAAEAIVARARGLGADLIAMTTHGRSELARHMLGSVADAVVRQADCPILLLRA